MERGTGGEEEAHRAREDLERRRDGSDLARARRGALVPPARKNDLKYRLAVPSFLLFFFKFAIHFLELETTISPAADSLAFISHVAVMSFR